MFGFRDRLEWRRRHRYDGTQRPDWKGQVRLDLSVRRHFGFAKGTSYQFAVGRWPDPIGDSLVLREDGFDLVFPLLGAAWPAMPPYVRWGSNVIPVEARTAFAAALRLEASRLRRLRFAAAMPPGRRLTPHRLRAFAPKVFRSGEYSVEEIRQAFTDNPLRYLEATRLFETLAAWLDGVAEVEPVSLLGI